MRNNLFGVEIYTEKEILEILEISKPTFRRLVKKHGINKTKIGKNTVYTDFEIRKIFIPVEE